MLMWDLGLGFFLGSLRLFHPGRLALQLAQVVQLRAAYAGRPHHIHFGDCRRVQRENALDTLAERYLAYRERCPRAAPVHADHDALEDLDAFLVALTHLDV